MASGGHNVKSKKHHEAMGNARPSRHNDRVENNVKVLDSIPKAPEYFDKRHRDKWESTCKKVFRMGILAEADLDLLEVYVLHWFIHQDAAKDIILNKSKDSEGKKNPSVLIAQDSARMINQIGDKFGMNSRARMGIKVDPQKPEDPFAKFLNN